MQILVAQRIKELMSEQHLNQVQLAQKISSWRDSHIDK